MKLIFTLFSMLLMLPASGSYGATLDEKHPFFSLIGEMTRDETKKAYLLHEPHGGLWQISDDGRTSAGTWRTDNEFRICYTITGITYGCFSVSKNAGVFTFHDPAGENGFSLVKSDYDKPIMSAQQKKLYLKATRAAGILTVDRGGDELLYWHADGSAHMVQPEGYLKVGNWWFDDKNSVCDNINNIVECLPIVKVEKDILYLNYLSNGFGIGEKGELVELIIRWQYFDQE